MAENGGGGNGGSGRPLVVVINLVLIVGLGVLGSFWLLHYTDWFPVVGGILGLTGAFAWVAFLSNIIKDKRKASAQDWIDLHILQNLGTIGVVAGLAAAFVFGFASWHGTLVIDSSGDIEGRNGEVREPGKPRDDATGLVDRIHSVGNGEVALLFASGFFGDERYLLKLDGLPAIEIAVAAWERTRVRVPIDFHRAPVLLVRPSAVLSGMSSPGEFVLTVDVDGKPYGRLDEYHGESVWIGATEDVVIPDAVINRWRLALLSQEASPDLVQRWLFPLSIVGDERIAEGSVVIARIVREGAGAPLIQGRAEAKIARPTSSAMFPQELVIHESNPS